MHDGENGGGFHHFFFRVVQITGVIKLGERLESRLRFLSDRFRFVQKFFRLFELMAVDVADAARGSLDEKAAGGEARFARIVHRFGFFFYGNDGGVPAGFFVHLITFDYADSMTGGLRRTCDALRPVIERTRSDLTATASQRELIEELKKARGN